MSTAQPRSVTQLTPKLEKELAEIAAETGCEIAYTEFGGGHLRFFLDHPQGTTLEQCEIFSKQASVVLDRQDFGSGQYILEVSSPGLDRRLVRAADYVRFLGKLARVRFEQPESGKKRTVVGVLDDFSDDGGGRIRLVVPESGETVLVPLQSIEVARLEVDLSLPERARQESSN